MSKLSENRKRFPLPPRKRFRSKVSQIHPRCLTRCTILPQTRRIFPSSPTASTPPRTLRKDAKTREAQHSLSLCPHPPTRLSKFQRPLRTIVRKCRHFFMAPVHHKSRARPSLRMNSSPTASLRSTHGSLLHVISPMTRPPSTPSAQRYNASPLCRRARRRAS